MISIYQSSNVTSLSVLHYYINLVIIYIPLTGLRIYGSVHGFTSIPYCGSNINIGDRHIGTKYTIYFMIYLCERDLYLLYDPLT